jgi:hypothetical protein
MKRYIIFLMVLVSFSFTMLLMDKNSLSIREEIINEEKLYISYYRFLREFSSKKVLSIF